MAQGVWVPGLALMRSPGTEIVHRIPRSSSSAQALSGFVKRFPASGYSEAATFWLGNAYFGKRDFKNAISTFRAFVSAHADGARAPEALLAIANCEAELKDNKAARKAFGELIKAYPKSEAAQAGRERLASLK